MRNIGNKNDWWDWGVILLIVAGGSDRAVGRLVGCPRLRRSLAFDAASATQKGARMGSLA